MRAIRKPGGWEVRLRYGNGQRGRFLIKVEDEAVARDRAARLQVMGVHLVKASRHAESRDLLAMAAATESSEEFSEAERIVFELAPSDVVKAGPRTFRDVAELWVSGELHQRYPDDVPFKKAAGLANSRAIVATFYALLGNRDIASVTTEEVDAAKQAIPSELEHETRRLYISHLRRVFAFAVDPLRLIEHSPVRGKFVPRKRQGREFPFLYPSEDALLLGCEEVEFEYRFLYGFLDRDGSRLSETLNATWDQADLERGVFCMENTKTGRSRVWKLDAAVLRALQLRATQLGGSPTGRIFTAPGGQRLTRQMVHGRFRNHLKLAGVTRRELHTATAERRPLRVHDLRATFVTLALAAGKPERWVMDRTGHQTSGQIARYTRQARHAAELQLGWFQDLPEALAMVDPAASQHARAEPGNDVHAQDSESLVEDALARALDAAQREQRWDAVKEIVRELRERRIARVVSVVATVEDARAG